MASGSGPRILITGNMGYVGPVVTRHLRAVLPQAVLIGYDMGYFAHCLTTAGPLPETLLNAQYFGDVRDMPDSVLEGVNAVVHLAAISNDPMGNRFQQATEEINHKASLDLAERAQRAGVASLVFASSCSVYGSAEGGARREGDPLNPLTPYARSKIATEEGLRHRDLPGMTVTCLRFGTACGFSDRLRLDLVLNDFVASALATGEIVVLSDGTPWRPLIDTLDMARAIEWAIQRPAEDGGSFLTVNVGSDGWNFRVRELAETVARLIPGTKVKISADAPPDTRSYRVDFALFARLAPHHQPRQRLEDTVRGLVEGLTRLGFDDRNFRDSSRIRLKMLAAHMDDGRLSPDLRWRADAGRH